MSAIGEDDHFKPWYSATRPIWCVAITVIFAASVGADPTVDVRPRLQPISRAQAQPSNQAEQQAVITVRDAAGVKDEAIPLSIQVQAPSSIGAALSIHVAELPKGARLTDGSRSVAAANERD